MKLKSNTELQYGKYRIIRDLGQGGFGITYLAYHTMLDKMVAIKEFFPKEYCDRDETTSHITVGTKHSVEIVEMLKGKFIKEARNISKLHHPNIITIHDIFQENETAYYVMEYVDGFSLSDLIKQKGALPEIDAVGFISKIAAAVGYMHSLSMNHLDLKPANIMIRKGDKDPILIDFGLSKQYDASGGQTSTTPVGISHGYAPIEQYKPGGVSSFSPQTDIYALGATLFALLTGVNPPHYSDILEEGLPEMPSYVTKQTAVAIEKAMEIKKINRPSSIDEFISMLPVGSKLIQDISTCSKQPSFNPLNESNSLMENDMRFGNQLSPKKENIVEETALLNVPMSSGKNFSKTAFENFKFSGSLEYIDLGLSVKWGTKLLGKAFPMVESESEVYNFHLEDGTIESPNVFLSKGGQLPSIRHFEELIERCSWTSFSIEEIEGWKITGPNGNVLFMPLGILNRYLTKESLIPNRLYYHFLYLGQFTHSLDKGVPTEANIWTIKES